MTIYSRWLGYLVPHIVYQLSPGLGRFLTQWKSNTASSYFSTQRYLCFSKTYQHTEILEFIKCPNLIMKIKHIFFQLKGTGNLKFSFLISVLHAISLTILQCTCKLSREFDSSNCFIENSFHRKNFSGIF